MGHSRPLCGHRSAIALCPQRCVSSGVVPTTTPVLPERMAAQPTAVHDSSGSQNCSSTYEIWDAPEVTIGLSDDDGPVEDPDG